MANEININEFLFGRTKAEKKLAVINSLDDTQIRKTTADTILRIYKECRGKRDRFYIAPDRREGNNWNSTIESVSECKKKAELCLYVQSTNTDSSVCVYYSEFNSGPNYHGYCHMLNKSFTYNAADIARTIRCILCEYIYYKYIEREERETQEKINSLLRFSAEDFYFKKWDCWHRMDFNEDLRKKYYSGKKAEKEYATAHVHELTGKSEDELKEIFKKVFVGELK